MPPTRWRRAVAFTRGHRAHMAWILAFTLVLGAMGAVEPWVFGQLLDALTAGDARRALLLGLVGLAGLGLVREVVTGLNNWLTWRTRIRMGQELLDATVTRLQILPLSFHQRGTVGETMTRVDRGIQGFVTALSELAFNVLPAIVYLVVSAVIMFRLEPRLALLVLLFAPLPAIVGALASPEQIRREKDLLDRWSKIYGRFNEVLHGILTVKSFAMEDVERRRFLGSVDAANAVVVRGVARDTWTGGARNLVVLIARLAAIGAGGWLALRGETTVGTVFAFLGYVGGLFGPVQGLTGVYQTLQKATVSLDAIFEILDAEDRVADAPDAKVVHEVRGRVDFDDVRFSYRSDRPAVLEGLDLHVEPGEMVAIVGPSGAGKTTMMGLLQRLYDPCWGSVRVDGVDIRRLAQRSLRAQIGVVLQDGVLFADTVRANIAYGRPDATQEQIEAAARAAHAHGFIAALPEGYDTKLSERGSLLSAGQRQRIAIARALLKDPPILVLDEATSALDAESEAAVQEALAVLLEGRTSFVIAHRLSTITAADRIVVLREGRIAEQGRHEELLARGGWYAALVQKQSGRLARGVA